jgi:hypothetical protein
MIHPDTELRYISPEVGYGVVATQIIPKGTITWVHDDLDQMFTPRQVSRMNPRMKALVETYTFRNAKGQYVLCWDHSRFVNHSFNSNCLSTCYGFEFAVRDIHPGEQITNDYGYLNITEPFEPIDEGTERKVVFPDDLLKMAPIWDDILAETFPLLLTVPQPLADLLPPRIYKKAIKIAQGKDHADSIARIFCPTESSVRP